MSDNSVELTCVECGIGFEAEPGETFEFDEPICMPCLEEEPFCVRGHVIPGWVRTKTAEYVPRFDRHVRSAMTSKRERLDRLVAEIDEVLAQSMADAVERTLQLATPHLAGQNPADELLPCCELYPHGLPMPVDELNLTAWVPLGPICE